MFKKALFGILVFAFICIALTVQGRLIAQTTQTEQPISQLIVQFHEEAAGNKMAPDAIDGRVQQLSEATGVTLQYVRPMSGDAHVLKLATPLSVGEAQTLAAQITRQSGVAYAEPDYIRHAIGDAPVRVAAPLLVPNDPSYSSQWHYTYVANTSEGINLPPAWDITTGLASTVVAVVDTGILSHSDLAGRTVPGYDFISDVFVGNDGNGRDNNPADPGDWILADECGFPHSAQDSSWHGTHVAGTIGAATNNASGVAGVNWNAKILPVRVLGKCGGYTSDIVDGMRWAAGLSVSGVPANANPADVINMSLGGSGSCSFTEQSAINEIVAAGTTVVVAAGNDNDDAANYSPASCDNIITVAANDRQGNRAYYSNFGSTVEVTAPGGETNVIGANGVLSTLDSGTQGPANSNSYAYYQGTSMATPHVAGVVSLVVAQYPELTPGEISAHLQATARPFPSGSSCTTSQCGAGIVDAFNALSTTPPDINTYLPVVFNGFTSQPQALDNPGFESGQTGWTEFSANGFDIIGQVLPTGVTPRTGSWAAWLGGAPNEISYVQQLVTVPAGSPFLAYYHWIASSDECGFDYAYVVVNGSVIADTYDLCTSSDTNGWVKHVVNLSTYAGQTISLQIRSETDSLLNSNLFVDDVSFQATGSAILPPIGATAVTTAAAGKTD